MKAIKEVIIFYLELLFLTDNNYGAFLLDLLYSLSFITIILIVNQTKIKAYILFIYKEIISNTYYKIN